MSAAVRDLLAQYDDPAPLLRALPHRPDTRERLERATRRMHEADRERLLADALDAPASVRMQMVDRYLRAYRVYAALFERACREAGIGGGDGH